MRISTRLRGLFSNLRYELTGERHSEFPELSRIRRLSDGRIGGWVQGEHNLEQNSGAWIEANAVVRGNAVVREYALVEGDAHVSENAIIEGTAKVSGKARISGNARIGGNARVSGRSRIWGEPEIASSSVIVDSDVYSSRDIRGSTITGSYIKTDAGDIINCTVLGGAEIVRGHYTQCDIIGDQFLVSAKTVITNAIISPKYSLSDRHALKSVTINGRTATLIFSKKLGWAVTGIGIDDVIKLDQTNIEANATPYFCVEEYLDIMEMFTRHAARIDARNASEILTRVDAS